jgi:hypothetical protein
VKLGDDPSRYLAMSVYGNPLARRREAAGQKSTETCSTRPAERAEVAE